MADTCVWIDIRPVMCDPAGAILSSVMTGMLKVGVERLHLHAC